MLEEHRELINRLNVLYILYDKVPRCGEGPLQRMDDLALPTNPHPIFFRDHFRQVEQKCVALQEFKLLRTCGAKAPQDFYRCPTLLQTRDQVPVT